MRLLRLAPIVLALSCQGPPPAVSPPQPAMRRLTAVQYTNAIHDVFGASVLVPTSLEPDEPAAGLFSVGASLTTISPRGVEQYEAASYQIATQVMADPALRAGVMPCEPAAAVDAACAHEAIGDLGRRLWRRPLSDAEIGRLTDVATSSAAVLGDFDAGFEFAIAAMLQSPAFVFRGELGEPDPEGGQRFTDYEMASRLSFFLWNTTPDAGLLDAAARGALTTDDGLEVEVERLLASPRAKEGVRNFFTEMLQLWELDALNKDPLLYPHMRAEVGSSAREQTLLDLEGLIFEDEAPYKEAFILQKTHVDRTLAAIYDIPAPAREGFGEAPLDEAGGRRGLLGQVSFLALAAHPRASSVTLRGKFIREVVLCHDIPPPPSDVNTAIPEASAEAPTMRERVAQHLSDPFCASCHTIMDPVGLGLENFDGIGRWRDGENDTPIDASTDLDGEPAGGPWELAGIVSDHPDLGRCLTITALQYANGHEIDAGERDLLDWQADAFERDRERVLGLFHDIAISDAFRKAGTVEP